MKMMPDEVSITQSEQRRKETGTTWINVKVSGCCRFLSFGGALCNVKQVDANVKHPSWWVSPFELATSFMSLGHYDRPFAFLIPKFSMFVTSPIVLAISPRTGAHIPSVVVYQKQMKYTYNVQILKTNKQSIGELWGNSSFKFHVPWLKYITSVTSLQIHSCHCYKFPIRSGRGWWTRFPS